MNIVQSLREKIRSKFNSLIGKTSPDSAFFSELHNLLVEADLGATVAQNLIDEIKSNNSFKDNSGEDVIFALLSQAMEKRLLPVIVPAPRDHEMLVLLVLGVNGVGKTTTCAKLAHFYRENGLAKNIILAACDTFRAAAGEQLKQHGQKLGVRVVSQIPGADPGAVLWDAIEAAKAANSDLLIVDTAGRMHNRADLARELARFDKMIAQRAGAAQCCKLLVLDSTIGQNSLAQARSFSEIISIDGLVCTKLDSHAKGGMIVRVAQELKLPTIFVGTGESYNDFARFEPSIFVRKVLDT